MIEVRRYEETDKEMWNAFNKQAKNSIFMLDRDYMDYHKDRFSDHSLLFFDEGDLIAMLPGCEKDGILYSHAGLTFGGFISNVKMKQHTMNDCFQALMNYGRENGWTKIVYKALPHIYHSQPAEEDRYALYSNGARLVTVDASTYVKLALPIKMPKGRKAQISRAKREGVEIVKLTDLNDYKTFIELENQVLRTRHDTSAVHSAEELKLLHDRFPQNIHLFCALKDNKMIAGTVVYEYDHVVHTQYMAADDEARVIGALDLAVATVMEEYKANKEWLDFGISTEHGRVYLNEGLIAQKEGFGGRTGVYEIWELDL